MRVRTLIVDDEPLARERIRTLLAGRRDIEVVGECGDGRKAVAAIGKHSPDLVFLDVQMPEVNGFGVIEAIGASRMPAVIFVTAYDQYALRAFEVHALDYLLKPFDRQRFHRAVERAIALVRETAARKEGGEFGRRLLSLLESLPARRKYLERLVIKEAGRVFFLKAREIDWIEAAGNYVRLHAGSQAHMLRDTISSLESRLNPDQFLRIHRSTIVNIERIKELHPWFRGEHVVILRDGTRLSLGRAYRARLEALTGNTPV